MKVFTPNGWKLADRQGTSVFVNLEISPHLSRRAASRELGRFVEAAARVLLDPAATTVIISPLPDGEWAHTYRRGADVVVFAGRADLAETMLELVSVGLRTGEILASYGPNTGTASFLLEEAA